MIKFNNSCKINNILHHNQDKTVTLGCLKIREFDIRKPLRKFWEWNIFSTFIVDNQ